MAQANGVDELAARRRALAAERQRRSRERKRGNNVVTSVDAAAGAYHITAAGSARDPMPSFTPDRRKPVGAPRIHGTERLESLGNGPAEFVGVPPETTTPAELVAAPDMDAVLGAKKFAALIGFMTRLSLDDIVARYGVAGLADVPAVGSVLSGTDPASLVDATVEFVKERAERCALKHGFGLRIPYEDEVVTIGAGAGSGVYLLRKLTGRLPEPGKGNPPSSRTVATDGPPSPDGADDGDAAFNRINVDVEAKEPLPSWMAG